ncbi:hypothetical protein [Hydrogenophaga sp.]|jgi:hypothetical protein|uniref:hypothetical protein n=1 Tax=Hydrogenophaga sp. TaxID=1904254 RepID=UPI003F7237B6
MARQRPDRADHPAPRHPVDRSPRAPGSPPPQSEDEHLELPHERDQSTRNTAPAPDAGMKQASKDLEAGQVDTDMRASPGLDAAQRKRYVPGAGGQRPEAQPAKESTPADPARRRR